MTNQCLQFVSSRFSNVTFSDVYESKTTNYLKFKKMYACQYLLRDILRLDCKRKYLEYESNRKQDISLRSISNLIDKITTKTESNSTQTHIIQTQTTSCQIKNSPNNISMGTQTNPDLQTFSVNKKTQTEEEKSFTNNNLNTKQHKETQTEVEFFREQ